MPRFSLSRVRDLLRRIPLFQLYSVLLPFFFVVFVIACGRPTAGSRSASFWLQILVEAAFILAPVLVSRLGKPLENWKGESLQTNALLTFTNVSTAIVIAARLADAGRTVAGVVAAGIVLCAIFMIFMWIVFLQRPREHHAHDYSSPLPRLYATKLLPPIALAAYFCFADTGDMRSAVTISAYLLGLYLVASILLWNRNLPWPASK
jgi:hypothetical protein